MKCKNCGKEYSMKYHLEKHEIMCLSKALEDDIDIGIQIAVDELKARYATCMDAKTRYDIECKIKGLGSE